MATSVAENPPHRIRWSFRRVLAAGLLVAIISGCLVEWRPIFVAVRLYQARQALGSRDAQSAIPILKSAVWAVPNHPEANFLLARAYRHTGDMNQVRVYLERAWKDGIPQKTIEREEWLAKAQSGQLREAWPHLSELLIHAGNDGREICEAYVNGMFLVCRFQEGFELLDVWQADYPDDSQPYLFRGRYLTTLSDTKGAAEAYREGLRREPARTDLQVLLAACLVNLHEFPEATAILDSLAPEERDKPAVMGLQSECLLEQGSIEQAEDILQRILQNDPQHFQARLILARLRFSAGRIKEALATLEELARESPYNLEVRYQFGLALQADGQSDRAATELKFVQTGREALQEARRMRELVMRGNIDHVALRYEIGKILLQYESPEAGAGWLRSVLEFEPTHQGVHAALADYYHRCGNEKLAQAHRAQLINGRAE